MRFRSGEILRELDVADGHVVLRVPRRSDLEGCRRHINALVREKAYIAIQKRVGIEAEKKWLDATLKRLSKGSMITIVTTLDGAIIGVASVWNGGFDANKHVAEIGIGLSAGRGLGIGTQMMTLLEEIARKHYQTRLLRLDCFSENTRALRLYRRLGFRKAGVLPGGCTHFGKPMDLWILAKKLA